MAATAKPQNKKGGIWGFLFWLFVVLVVAVPEAAAAIIPLAIIGVVIFVLVQSNKKTPAQIAEAMRRARAGQAARPKEAAISDVSYGGEAAQAKPSQQASTPYYPPLADTGENFDFRRSGREGRAHIDGVRRDDDHIYEIDVTIRPRGGEEYRTTLVTAVPMDRLAELVKGRTLGVRVDPSRPGGPIFVM